MKYRCTSLGAMVLLAAAMATTSCSKKDRIDPPAAGTTLITADFQAGFSKSRVQYLIDDWQVFDRTLTTQPASGLAFSQPVGLQSGRHRVGIVVDGRRVKDTAIDLRGDVYLGVNNDGGDLRLLVSDIRWSYE